MAVNRITVSPALQALFDEGRALHQVTAVISSNLEYMMALEYGHSNQAPQGMVRIYATEYQVILEANLQHALVTYQGDLVKAAKAGVTFGALEIMRAIADRTPVDTGRAKNDWIVTTPDGRQMSDEETGQRPISPEQQKAIRAARRKTRSLRPKRKP